MAESSDTESGDYGEAESDGVSAEDEMDVVFEPVMFPKVLDQVLSIGEAEGKSLNAEEVILVTKEEMHDGVNVKIGGGDRLAVN